jgi:peptide/nickel transport system permease protein
MIRYFIRRLLWAIVLLFGVTIVSFVLFFLIPADPARLACGRACGEADVKRTAAYLGTDKPFYVQYWKFFYRLMPFSFHKGFHLKAPDLGRSFVNREAVSDIVTKAAPITASLVFGAVIIWLLMALPIGILSALRPRSLLDRFSMTAVLIGISAHPIWIGLIFSFLIGYKLGWTPIQGYADFFNPLEGQPGGPLQWAWHLILPWITLAILYAALYVRMIRANVLDTMGEDYVRTARAKGAPERIVMRSHILRNALLPLITMLGMDVGVALGGAVFTETVYGMQGLGWSSINALNAYDSPTVMGIILFATTAIIVFNLFVDLLYAVVDPRIKLA